ncbi:hypothetical protein QUB33_24505 [Microcoleus sp. B3-A4]|uniref:hypothetical protein n=1 Tax=Microcoleus sp. B3-A4 TaxID=2818653 RepID=UPI002FD26DE0
MQSISQKGWDKYLDRKAAEFLQAQQIIKSHPIPGGGGQAPGFLVLRRRGEQYATHFYNSQDGGFHHGHYFANLAQAEADFARRVTEYAPATN